jgi:hypothetical protein
MNKLDRLKKDRAKWRKRRNRQYRKYLKAKKRGSARANGHLKVFRQAKLEVEAINRQIKKEEARLERLEVIPREEWNAEPPNGSYSRQPSLIAGVQHHTAMPTLPAKASKTEECARMRQLQAIHQGQGWTDIGYHFVIFPSGRVYEGRPAEFVGAHTLNHNTGYGGWSLDGNYDVSKPTKAAIEACHRVRKDMIGDKPVYSHSDLNPTDCPGKNLRPLVGKEI